MIMFGSEQCPCHNAVQYRNPRLLGRVLRRIFSTRPDCAQSMSCNWLFHGEPMRYICRIFYVASLVCAAPCLAADAEKRGPDTPGSILMIQAAPTAIHFQTSPDYSGTPWLVGAEWQHPSRWLAGYSYFNNSYDQKCHYLYA